ncbi:hypothetical protein DRE_00484 [Drechslerella stenobrocha 248]|uniref:Uncharacterized protein n=1 Tax=Drechslerella stenobrocha 248 TaxID=1043628 RepID=W7HTQ7_9PEZI|nr:hypothetical protein DRE_00484 [Drechslerella stenobrocha 248]
MTRGYFKEFLEEARNIRPLRVKKQKGIQSLGGSIPTAPSPSPTTSFGAPDFTQSRHTVASPRRKAVLRKWGDLGADIPESTPSSIRGAMVDLEEELRWGPKLASHDPSSTAHARAMNSGSALHKPSSKFAQALRNTSSIAPIASGPLSSQKRSFGGPRSTAERQSTQKEAPPRQTAYEPPLRPYLHSSGATAHDNNPQPKQRLLETNASRKHTKFPIDTSKYHQRGVSKDYATKESYPTNSGLPASLEMTSAMAVGHLPLRGASMTTSTSFQHGGYLAAGLHTSEFAPRVSPAFYPSKVASERYGYSPKPAPKGAPPLAGSRGVRSSSPVKNAAAPSVRSNISISPTRRENTRLRPFGIRDPSAGPQANAAKPRLQRTGKPQDLLTTRVRPLEGLNHPKSTFLGQTSPVHEGTYSSAEEPNAPEAEPTNEARAEHVNLNDSRYILKGKDVEGKSSIRGGWI